MHYICGVFVIQTTEEVVILNEVKHLETSSWCNQILRIAQDDM